MRLHRWLVGFVVWAMPLAVMAQETSVAGQEKTIPGGTLALVAYIAFVAFMCGYLALLSWRQRNLDRDIDDLERRLDELAELE